MSLSRTPDEIIDEFFTKDGVYESNNKTRRSVFLALERDMRILRGLDLDKPPISMTKQQLSAFNDRIPSFGFISVFCSSIDVLARVWKGRSPDKIRKTRNGRNETTGVFFKAFSKRWLGLTTKRIEELYNLRNSISHQYIVGKNHGAYPHGFAGIIKKGLNGSWLFNLNGMYSAFTKIKREFTNHAKNLSPGKKRKIAEYLQEHGFYWNPKQ